jgi:hypothetical protein
MTDPTISTDPATLRDLAATLRMDEVRVCPHYLKLDLLADTYDAIAAEKEAQAAQAGDLVELVSDAIARDIAGDSDHVKHVAKLAVSTVMAALTSRANPMTIILTDEIVEAAIQAGCETGNVAYDPAFTGFDMRAALSAALSAIAAAGCEIRPRAYTAGERLGGGLVAAPREPTRGMVDAGAKHAGYEATALAYHAMLAALTEKGERSDG